MYITLAEYSKLYNPMEEPLFNRLCFDACRVMDIHTTGIDNVKKLKKFFPTDEYDSNAVKYCAAKLINILYQIHEAEKNFMELHGYESTGSGLHGKVISSVTAGNESISYATGNSKATAIDAAVSDKTAKDKLLVGTVRDYLQGVDDVNGVSLLYMGSYPRRYLC